MLAGQSKAVFGFESKVMGYQTHPMGTIFLGVYELFAFRFMNSMSS
jgi:hypothetical protein